MARRLAKRRKSGVGRFEEVSDGVYELRDSELFRIGSLVFFPTAITLSVFVNFMPNLELMHRLTFLLFPPGLILLWIENSQARRFTVLPGENKIVFQEFKGWRWRTTVTEISQVTEIEVVHGDSVTNKSVWFVELSFVNVKKQRIYMKRIEEAILLVELLRAVPEMAGPWEMLKKFIGQAGQRD